METTKEDRGAGGKLRKPSARKPPPTPYARPPPTPHDGGSRWLSKLVDPACRLISSGATRIFPLFFSKPLSTDALPPPNVQDHDKLHTEVEQDGGGDKCTFDLGISRSTGVGGLSGAAGRSKSGSDFDGRNQDKRADLSEDNGLSEIEQLLTVNRFSRDEVNRLTEILHSRAVDLNPSLAAGDPQGLVVARETPRTSLEEQQEDLSRDIWGSSTPLLQSTVQDELGASLVEIAKAYMGNRESDIGLGSKSITSKDERALLPHGDECTTKQFIPSASPKPSTCWPGAMVQDQHGYLTPESQRGRVGLHNFPRTPYSRTIFSKSKTRVTQLQGDRSRSVNISSTPLRQSQTPIYGQVKSRSDALDSGYGSVGPIRRIRHKALAESSSRGSVYFHSSLNGPSQVENSNVSEGFLPSVNKNMELGGTSSTKKFQSLYSKPHSSEVGVPTVHSHTTQLARKILEHIDRNPPTPKDKSAELQLAASWNKPEPSDVTNVMSNEQNSLPHLGDFDPRKNRDLVDLKNSAQRNKDRGNSRFKVPPQQSISEANDAVNKGSSASDINVSNTLPIFGGNTGYSVDFTKTRDSQIKSAHEDVSKIIPNAARSEVLHLQKQPRPHSSVTKPVLPSISINKPDSRWPFTSDNSSGFTFPVSSSGVLSEPPTPSIMPSFSAGGLQQPKEGHAVPSYSFGSKRSTPGLVFSFPSTSNAVIHEDALDIKFSFGSEENTRLSFSSFKKDAICY